MAGTIRISQQLILENGSLKKVIQPTNMIFVQDNPAAYEDVNTIPTSEEAVTSFGSITTEGWCFLHNLDGTNYVEVGFSTGVYGIRLESGETAMFRLNPGADLYMKANTAACRVYVTVLED